MQPGYYWYYTLNSLGEPLESPENPSICYYNDGELTLLGYGLWCEYTPEKYRLLKRITWE